VSSLDKEVTANVGENLAFASVGKKCRRGTHIAEANYTTKDRKIMITKLSSTSQEKILFGPS